MLQAVKLQGDFCFPFCAACFMGITISGVQDAHRLSEKINNQKRIHEKMNKWDSAGPIVMVSDSSILKDVVNKVVDKVGVI